MTIPNRPQRITGLPSLELSAFFPFRLNRLADEVSVRLSRVYADHYGIGIVEWRIIATLGEFQRCTAKTIASSTRTHKSRISRAVGRLVDEGYVQQSPDPRDSRERNLSLTRRGKSLYQSLAIVVLKQEAAILDCLNQEEQQALYSLFSKLESALELHTDKESQTAVN